MALQLRNFAVVLLTSRARSHERSANVRGSHGWAAEQGVPQASFGVSLRDVARGQCAWFYLESSPTNTGGLLYLRKAPAGPTLHARACTTHLIPAATCNISIQSIPTSLAHQNFTALPSCVSRGRGPGFKRCAAISLVLIGCPAERARSKYRIACALSATTKGFGA